MNDIKKSEWLVTNDVITDDVKNGKLLRVIEVKHGDVAVEAIRVEEDPNKTVTFISDADVTKYYKLTNYKDD
jgi:hypothetical protein